MNSLLMVLATARDKIRLVKSAGRRSNCCWDSGGSFDGEGYTQVSHVSCGFRHIVSLNLCPTYLRNDRKNWKKFWQRGHFIQRKRKFIRASTFLLYGTVISRTLQKIILNEQKEQRLKAKGCESCNISF